MVWVRFRVICGYDLILNMSTAVRIKLKIEKWQFTPTVGLQPRYLFLNSATLKWEVMRAAPFPARYLIPS